MKFIEEIELLKRLDQLIRLKATGTPTQLASRLNVSERTIFNQIDTLRILGAPIKFCKKEKCYYYVYDVKLLFAVKRAGE
jgi:predicted DNA-binding transcriptional regulator YafY